MTDKYLAKLCSREINLSWYRRNHHILPFLNKKRGYYFLKFWANFSSSYCYYLLLVISILQFTIWNYVLRSCFQFPCGNQFLSYLGRSRSDLKYVRFLSLLQVSESWYQFQPVWSYKLDFFELDFFGIPFTFFTW